MPDLLIATRAIHFAATGMTAGVLLFVPYVGDPAFGGQGAARSAGAIRFRARLLRIAWIGLLATVGSGAIWVLLESAAMSGASLADAVDSGAPWTVLSETHFGMVADIRLLIAVGLAASLTFAGTSRLSLWIATALAAFLLAAIASTGHAAGTPGLAGAVHLSADALHLLAAGAWIGGLLPLGLILVTAYSEGESGWVPIARTATLRFSRLGIASVGTLLATGVVNTWILAGSVPALIGTDYGHLLLIKIALFAMMMALAAINRLRLTPLLSNESAPLQRGALRRLARNATAELALGLAIFGVVGALGTLPPGLHAQPVWPLPFRLSTDILADPDFGSRALVAVAVAVVGVALILGGLLQPKRRWLLILAGTLVVLSVARELTGFFERASPTTFFASPTGYSAESIAQGHQIFLENCAVCHGTSGRGDGPAAATAERSKPADLTADHIYAHRDGDLFGWITDGIDNAMPAFREVLNETARWNVIDFIHANADATRLQVSVGQVGPVGYPTPDFSASCRGDTIASLTELRGNPVHVVSAAEGSIEALKPAVERDRALGVTTVVAVNGLAGSDAMPCVSDDLALLETMGIYGGVDAERMGRTEWLVDASGLLRSLWYPQPGAPEWTEDEVYRQEIQVLREQPASPKRSMGHMHH